MRCRKWISPRLELILDCGPKTSRRRTTPTLRLPFDELYFVAVRILGEGDHGRAAFDRTRLARHLSIAALDLVADLLHIGHFDCDMAESRAEVVSVDAVVVGQ